MMGFSCGVFMGIRIQLPGVNKNESVLTGSD